MKVYAISDLHLSINNPKPMDIFGGAWENYLQDITDDWAKKVSDDDVVLIAGDISWAMTLAAAQPDLAFIGELRGHKVILRGNHDYWWKTISGVRQSLSRGCYAVQNDVVRIGSLLVCGTRGWATPEGKISSDEDKKIYDREVIRLGLSLQQAAKQRKEGDKVVVMLHYPPFNSRLEPTPFTRQIAEFAPDAVVYGHLHGKAKRVTPHLVMDGISYYLTSCDLVDNKLVEILSEV